LLTVVLGYTDLILDRIDGDDDLHEDMEQIKKAGERAASLTRQLLAFSRKQVMQPRIMDLNAAVKDIEQMLRRLIGEDIELTTVPSADLAPVFADPTQIGQVIMNLAVNARDAMPHGGKLTIETANVFLEDGCALHHQVTPGPYVLLAISDTGKGMDQETRSHVFEPFFTTKQLGKGTGLGLATVYGIIKQSNGHVSVYSEPDRGSTFKVYLPVVKGLAESLESSFLSAGIPGGSESILLVEDDTLVRRVAVEVLTRAGYQVVEASNGREALQIFGEQEGRLHLMVTDVVMPGMSGRDLADKLADLNANIKVLFMSGYTENAVVHHGILEPGLAFIQKPFTPLDLARKVREVLDA
jgi:two-component system, cell cycle sensor histidine kinase and response regulator CckA